MGTRKKKLIIGIMGGICSGKSTVAAEFAKLGCKVIDADKIAHESLEKDDVKKKIAALFGGLILNPQNKIDRKKLADIVFSDSSRLLLLNSIIHPIVLARASRLMRQYKHQKRVKAIVLDMPLLVEVGWEKRCDKLIFVHCKPRLRLKRAKKTGFFDKKQLKVREKFQISLDKKANISDNVIDNNSDISALVKQVACIFSSVIND